MKIVVTIDVYDKGADDGAYLPIGKMEIMDTGYENLAFISMGGEINMVNIAELKEALDKCNTD